VPDTFIKIASVTVGSGGAANIDFTSIPSTYTDLCVKVSARNTSTNDYYEVRFNTVSTNLSGRYLQGDGSTVASGVFQAYGRMNSSSTTSNTFASGDIYVTNYAGSNNKSLSVDSVSENNGTTAIATLTAGLWSSTAAITSIQLVPSGNNFAQYSTAVLYGIKNS
jgi:hypothetical protein